MIGPPIWNPKQLYNLKQEIQNEAIRQKQEIQRKRIALAYESLERRKIIENMSDSEEMPKKQHKRSKTHQDYIPDKSKLATPAVTYDFNKQPKNRVSSMQESYKDSETSDYDAKMSRKSKIFSSCDSRSSDYNERKNMLKSVMFPLYLSNIKVDQKLTQSILNKQNSQNEKKKTKEAALDELAKILDEKKLNKSVRNTISEVLNSSETEGPIEHRVKSRKQKRKLTKSLDSSLKECISAYKGAINDYGLNQGQFYGFIPPESKKSSNKNKHKNKLKEFLPLIDKGRLKILW
ncbi:unnamed protein product [Blepharisma stoltei]|uniref:Uncharacterized protein n=1 Tax=Blepharisma stoltei TaxID=1481888 RepID=A0AAU9JVB0_9CILI|nr:unnamed protein product [Blepharisma stoltei]